MLAPIFDPADGVAFAHRKPGKADFFGQQNSLVTESAADVRRHDSDLPLLDAQTIGQAVAHDVRHLRAGIKRELVEAVIEGGDHAAPFKRRHALTRGRYFARHLDRRIEGRRDIDLDGAFEKDVVAPMLVDERRFRVTRLAHVVDGGKLFEVQRHRGRDIFGLRPRRRHAHRDEFSDVAHFAGRKNGLFGYLEAGQAGHRADRLDAGQIRGREHDVAITFRHMDGSYPGMRQRAADEGDILQAGEPDIGHVLAASAHEAIVFLARQPCADTLCGVGYLARRKIAFNVRH